MTEFERIKKMDVVDLAIYISKLQLQAINDYEKGYFPKSIFDNVAMLEGAAVKKLSIEEQVAAAQSKRESSQDNDLHRGEVVREQSL